MKTKSHAPWWRLVEHVADTQYALTGWNDNFVEMTAENFTVGDLCRHIATTNLALPYRRHLHWDENRIFPNFDPQEGLETQAELGRQTALLDPDRSLPTGDRADEPGNEDAGGSSPR